MFFFEPVNQDSSPLLLFCDGDADVPDAANCPAAMAVLTWPHCPAAGELPAGLTGPKPLEAGLPACWVAAITQ